MRGVVQGLERAAELDQVAIAVFPFVEIVEVLYDFVEVHGGSKAQDE